MQVNETWRETTKFVASKRPRAFGLENLSVFLAVNGVVVLLFSSLIGLALARALYRDDLSEHWHLLHASGTSRGVMLLALATTIQFAELPPTSLVFASGLVVFFVWTSLLAMLVRGLSGERGFHPGGSHANKVVFYLYASGAVTLLIGLVWLGVGFLRAWN